MSKTRIKTRPFDMANYLQSEEDIAECLRQVLEEGDAALLAAALGDVARASNMAQLARDTGLSREGLYKALSADGNPSMATVMKVMKAMGLKLSVESMETHA